MVEELRQRGVNWHCYGNWLISTVVMTQQATTIMELKHEEHMYLVRIRGPGHFSNYVTLTMVPAR